MPARAMLPRLGSAAALSLGRVFAGASEAVAAGTSTAYMHTNCVANAAGFFNNVRTPAALLTIPALTALW